METAELKIASQREKLDFYHKKLDKLARAL